MPHREEDEVIQLSRDLDPRSSVLIDKTFGALEQLLIFIAFWVDQGCEPGGSSAGYPRR